MESTLLCLCILLSFRLYWLTRRRWKLEQQNTQLRQKLWPRS